MKKIHAVLGVFLTAAFLCAAPALAGASTVAPNPVTIAAADTTSTVTVNYSGLPANQRIFITQCYRATTDPLFDPFASCSNLSEVTINPSDNAGSGTAQFPLFHGAEPTGDVPWGCFATGETVPSGIDGHTTCYVRITVTSETNLTDQQSIPFAFNVGVVTPPPDVPESALPIALPLVGAAVAGATFITMRRRRPEWSSEFHHKQPTQYGGYPRMRINWRKASVALAAGLTGALALSGVAGASTSIPGSGQDNKNDIIVGQGSDTTYVVTNELFQLYNQSPGCKTDTVTGSGTLGQCLTGTSQDAPQNNAGDNWDHDVVTGQYPTGSGAGIRALINNQVDFARSSTGPTSAATPSQAGLNFWAFAKDGIAVVTAPGRGTVALTTATVKGIYNCTITTWGAALGTADATPIVPYGMQTSSGTYNIFKNYLGFDPDAGACVKKLADGTYPFENNLSPVLADATAQGFGVNNVIWWSSFGELKTYAFKAAGANFATVDGQSIGNSTISSNAWPITRFLFHVTKKADANPSAAGSSDLTGATTGAAGGVRQFTQWLCKERTWFTAGTPTAPTNAALNPYFGTYYYDDATNTISQNGFQRVPAAARTNGACGLQVATS